MTYRKSLIFLIIIVCMSGCKAPKEAVKANTINPLDNSSITLQTELSTYRLADKLRNDLQGNIINYESPEINLQLLAEEANTITEIVERIVKPGYWTTTMKSVKKKVEKTVKCWLNPFKWKNCIKETWVTVLVPTSIWIEPIKENVPKEVLQLIDKTFGTSGKVRVKGQLQQLDIDMNSTSKGVDFKVTTIVNMNLKVDVKQSFLDGLAGNIKVKGLLNCDNIKVKVESKGSFRLNSDIQLEASHNDAKVTFLDACSNLPLLSFDYQPLLLPTFEALDLVITKLVEGKLNETIEESLAEEVSEMNLKEELTKLVKDNLKGVPLGKIEDNIWLIPSKLESIKLDQLQARNNNLIFRMNIKIQPEIYYGENLPVMNFELPQIVLNNDFDNKFKTRNIVRLDYNTLGNRLTDELNSSIKSYYEEDPQIPNLTGNKYFIDKIRLYPNGERLAFEFKLYRINKKNKRKLVRGKTYITAKLGFANDTLKLDDLDLFIENTPILNLANLKPLKNYLLKELKKSSAWSVKETLDKFRATLNTSIRNDQIAIVPKMELEPNIPIYINKETIDLYADFEGTLNIDLLPNRNKSSFTDPDFIALNTMEDLYREAGVPEVVEMVTLNSMAPENSNTINISATNSFLKFNKFKNNKEFQIKKQDSKNQKETLLRGKIPGDTLILESKNETFFYILQETDFPRY
ncbi:DUF4403 family protein [Ascidiimonas sp. W6]|uniref:DUF4403 family protein n=1 Tax=Ascidiimonas meishanensis TaxID=3128903 RepID=UPI0030ED8ED6